MFLHLSVILFTGVSVHRGLSPWGLCLGGLCPGGSLSWGRGSLSRGRGVSVHGKGGLRTGGGGLCPGSLGPGGSLSRGVSVRGGSLSRGGLCPGGPCLVGLCPGRLPRRTVTFGRYASLLECILVTTCTQIAYLSEEGLPDGWTHGNLG